MEVATTILVMDREDMGSKVTDKMDMGHKEDTEARVMEPKILVVEKPQEVLEEVTEMDTVTEVDMINMEVATTILVMDREDMGSKVTDKMDMGHKEDTEARVMELKILVVEKLQEVV